MEGGLPFRVTEMINLKRGRITIIDWLQIWDLLFFTNYMEAFKYILYIGFDGRLTDCAKIKK